jgi:hypothetical protein
MFVKAGKTFVDVSVVDWKEVPQKIRVRIEDIVRYFAREARSLSGCRNLAGITGDWRPIENLAQEILSYFKDVNVETLRRESRKAGLIPKF